MDLKKISCSFLLTLLVFFLTLPSAYALRCKTVQKVRVLGNISSRYACIVTKNGRVSPVRIRKRRNVTKVCKLNSRRSSLKRRHRHRRRAAARIARRMTSLCEKMLHENKDNNPNNTDNNFTPAPPVDDSPGNGDTDNNNNDNTDNATPTLEGALALVVTYTKELVPVTDKGFGTALAENVIKVFTAPPEARENGVIAAAIFDPEVTLPGPGGQTYERCSLGVLLKTAPAVLNWYCANDFFLGGEIAYPVGNNSRNAVVQWGSTTNDGVTRLYFRLRMYQAEEPLCYEGRTLEGKVLRVDINPSLSPDERVSFPSIINPEEFCYFSINYFQVIPDPNSGNDIVTVSGNYLDTWDPRYAVFKEGEMIDIYSIYSIYLNSGDGFGYVSGGWQTNAPNFLVGVTGTFRYDPNAPAGERITYWAGFNHFSGIPPVFDYADRCSDFSPMPPSLRLICTYIENPIQYHLPLSVKAGENTYLYQMHGYDYPNRTTTLVKIAPTAELINLDYHLPKPVVATATAQGETPVIVLATQRPPFFPNGGRYGDSLLAVRGVAPFDFVEVIPETDKLTIHKVVAKPTAAYVEATTAEGEKVLLEVALPDFNSSPITGEQSFSRRQLGDLPSANSLRDLEIIQ
ncbi:MAG: hypothetical protein D6780_02700 [Candidatus Dadabacteria bacterium]|nr:MAG: hypothetical protein D6780_02700 [Candidatus Dadabacteria bacterium]